MAVELALPDEVAQRELTDHLRAAVLDGLGRRQLPRQPRGQQHPAEPHARSQALAGGADVGDPLGRETLQRADRDAVVAVLRVVVVLDDQAFVAGPVDERRAPLRAQHGAGRKLVRRRDEDRRDVGRGERLDDDAAAVDRNRHDLEPSLLDDQPVNVPAGILERDLLDAVAAQRAAQQREALHEAGAEHHVLGIGAGPRTRPRYSAERFAQRRHAARVAVAERVERRVA